MMAEVECQFLIGHTLVCLHLLLPADLREVREKNELPGGEISAIVDFVSSCLTMFLSLPQCPDFLMLHIWRRGQF